MATTPSTVAYWSTRRALREYLALSYEANHKIAKRIGITVVTLNGFLSGERVHASLTTNELAALPAPALSDKLPELAISSKS